MHTSPTQGCSLLPPPRSPGGLRARQGGTTTLRFWAMGRESEVAAELIAGFEREHPACA